MKISDIITRLEDWKDANVAKREVLGWLRTIDPERDLIRVEKLRVGDTFWHTVVGGKRRPWVVLWVRKGVVGAASLTHADMEHGWACQDRLWRGCYIGPTLIIVNEEGVKNYCYYPYTNVKHLAQIKQEIKRKWG